MTRYGFRWRLFYKCEGIWLEPFRFHPKLTMNMLSIIWERLARGPGGKRWLYIVIPGIVDVDDHMWGLHGHK